MRSHRVNVKEKPCVALEYCPYGVLVEEFRLASEKDIKAKKRCGLFGHVCPAFEVAEKFDKKVVV